MATTGASLPGGDNANRCAQAGIIPSVLQVHTQRIGICVRILPDLAGGLFISSPGIVKVFLPCRST